jgi:hypothetical protein
MPTIVTVDIDSIHGCFRFPFNGDDELSVSLLGEVPVFLRVNSTRSSFTTPAPQLKLGISDIHFFVIVCTGLRYSSHL